MKKLSVNQDEIITKGELVLVTSGEYSDFMVNCIGRATFDINMNDIVREYKARHREAPFNDIDFLDWLLKTRKAIELVNHSELHVSYMGDDIEVRHHEGNQQNG